MKVTIHLTGCILLILAVFLITILATTSVSKPIGADFYFHLDIAKYYAQGNFVAGINYSLTNNYFFYPPAFHLSLAPLVWSGNPYFYALVLETLLMPLTFAFTIYLMNKYASAKAAFITGVCLLGSLAFVDGTMQLRPESIDLLLYPLMLLTVLSTKKKSFIVMAVVTVYSHGAAALSNIYGIATKLLKDKVEWRKTITIGVVAITPVIAISIYYIQGAIHKWLTFGGANQSNPQQTLFWTQPLTFIPIYSGLTLLGFFFLLKKHKNPFESLLTWGIIGSTIMLPFWADRWLQYITIPLSCLVGLGLQNTKRWKLIPIYILLITVTAGYITYWILVGLLHGWWQPGD